MRRTILLAGVLPFVSAFFGGVLAINLTMPSQATAQAGQLQEVRASAFTVVAPDGTELASLGAGGEGNGRLQLNHSDGSRRVSLRPSTLTIWEPDGTIPALRVGRTRDNEPGGAFRGVELGPGGAITTASGCALKVGGSERGDVKASEGCDEIAWTGKRIQGDRAMDGAEGGSVTTRYVYWQDDDAWLGYLEDYPDYWTQGASLDDLQAHLADLYKELTSGAIPGARRVASLQVR